jgi:hypothetical protein
MTATNALTLPLHREVLLGPQPADQPNLPLVSEGVQRFVWNSTYGAMLIEVRDGAAFVNGGRVTPIEELRAVDAATPLETTTTIPP